MGGEHGELSQALASPLPVGLTERCGGVLSDQGCKGLSHTVHGRGLDERGVGIGTERGEHCACIIAVDGRGQATNACGCAESVADGQGGQ